MKVEVREKRVKERECRLGMEEERRRTYTTEEPRRDGTNDNTDQNGSDTKDLNMQ